MNLFKLTFTAGLIALMSLTACSDDDEGSSSGGSSESTGAGDSSGSGDTTGSGDSVTTGQSQSASCCLNGEFFDCGSDFDAAEDCFNNGDPGSCSADPGRDLDCE